MKTDFTMLRSMKLKQYSVSPRQRTIVTIVLAIILLTLLPAVFIGPSASAEIPSGLRYWAFDVRLATAIPLKSLNSLISGNPLDKRVYFDIYGENVSFQSDGLTIKGYLYREPADQPQPAIVLLHGSSPFGKRLGLYRLLGEMLSHQGYVVLSIDQRGYWASDNPKNLDDPEDLDFAGDVSSAVDYLLTQPGIDPERLYVVGHSFGGDVALTAGIQDARLKKIVAIAPGRRFTERGGDPNSPEFDYFKHRDQRYMWLWESIPTDVYLESRAKLPIENHVDYFSSADHKPLFLIDGGLESADDREFLQTMVNNFTEPKRYVTLENADHYANIANFGPVVIYDSRVIQQLVQEIDLWLQDNGKG
ncbi:MAG: alpha/beta fold hydrolase [Anaerolineae bacterium]|nr:alpha/beta fold hydrolase [Anaerolineae bacterium]